MPNKIVKAIYEWHSGIHRSLDGFVDPAFYTRLQTIHDTAEAAFEKKKAEDYGDWLSFSAEVHHPPSLPAPPERWEDWPLGV